MPIYKRAQSTLNSIDGLAAVCTWSHEIEEIVYNHNSLPIDENIQIDVVRTFQEIRYCCARGFVSPYKYFAGEHDFYPIQIVFKRKLATSIGGFSETMPVLEDRSLFSQMILQAPIFCIPETLAWHHLRGDSGEPSVKNTIGDNDTYDWESLFTHTDLGLLYDRRSVVSSVASNAYLYKSVRDFTNWKVDQVQKRISHRIKRRTVSRPLMLALYVLVAVVLLMQSVTLVLLLS
jgi:hypothetical protein